MRGSCWKIEILVLGGTWDHYPRGYQTEFIRDIYHSVNTLDKRMINKLSLKEEIKLSEKSDKRLIGLTLETRPTATNVWGNQSNGTSALTTKGITLTAYMAGL